MRVNFIPPSENEFKQLFLSTPLKKRGNGIEDIAFFQPKGLPSRRGNGIFSFISGVAKRILPFLIKAAKPSAQEFGSSIVRDIINKKPIRKSLKKNGIKAIKKTGMRILKGSGKKFKKKNNKRTSKRRGYKSCVFDT